jgi:hypothetical protein
MFFIYIFAQINPMVRFYNIIQKVMFTAAAVMLFVVAFAADGKKKTRPDSTKFTRIVVNKNDKSYLRNGFKVPLPPLKANPAQPTNINLSTVTASHSLFTKQLDGYKTLSNVQVYPNPITDQINLRYSVAKNSNVTIKIMDVLGNDVITLFSQRVDSGEQKVTFNISNKLSSGFYFVRLIVGTESVIKRISIL